MCTRIAECAHMKGLHPYSREDLMAGGPEGIEGGAVGPVCIPVCRTVSMFSESCSRSIGDVASPGKDDAHDSTYLNQNAFIPSSALVVNAAACFAWTHRDFELNSANADAEYAFSNGGPVAWLRRHQYCGRQHNAPAKSYRGLATAARYHRCAGALRRQPVSGLEPIPVSGPRCTLRLAGKGLKRRSPPIRGRVVKVVFQPHVCACYRACVYLGRSNVSRSSGGC